MSLPEASDGLVVGVSYLWAREQRAGAVDGLKNRPCMILMVRKSIVLVLPITSAPEYIEGEAWELPDECKEEMGIYADVPQWISVSEVNMLRFDGPFIKASAPGGNVVYGKAPAYIFEAIRNRAKRHYGGIINIDRCA